MASGGPYETTLATVAAGRATTSSELSTLADRRDALPLDAAAELMMPLEPVLDDRRPAALALELGLASR